jgi:hypothetical protein
MEALVGPAQRLLDDASVKRKGNVHVGVLGPDAEAAEREITNLIETQLKRRLHPVGGRAGRSRASRARDLELVSEVDARTWFRSVRTNILADTTDEELADIVADHQRTAATSKAHAYTVLLNAESYLRAQREKLRERDRSKLEATAERIKKSERRRDELIVQVRSFGDATRAIATLAGLSHTGVLKVLNRTTYAVQERRTERGRHVDREELRSIATAIKKDERRRERLIGRLASFGDSAPAIAQLAGLSKTGVGNALKRMTSTAQTHPTEQEEQQ